MRSCLRQSLELIMAAFANLTLKSALKAAFAFAKVQVFSSLFGTILHFFCSYPADGQCLDCHGSEPILSLVLPGLGRPRDETPDFAETPV